MSDAEAFERIVQQRQSIRDFDPDEAVPPEVIQRSLQRALLAPNSSNLQLWEFHWVRSPEKKRQLASFCLGQRAARSAAELVVIVTRRDLWRERARAVLRSHQERIQESYGSEVPRREQRYLLYWGRLIPALYGWSWLGPLKRAMAWLRGWRAPTPREVGPAQLQISAERSVALAAMTFLHSLRAEGYDSCCMEGHDSARVRRLLGLPRGATISMVVAAGVRREGAELLPRFRLPLPEVLFEH